MRNFTFTFLFIFSVISFVNSQSIVTTSTQYRNAVLEVYTGITCQFCPDGDAISEQLRTDNPGRVVSIDIHQGGYAVPTGSQPDYRTSFGDALAGQTGLSGYPAGSVNRHVFPGYSVTGVGRGDWGAEIPQVLQEQSCVNVGFTSTFDTTSRLLTVNVELYYTGNSNAATNYINVALVQNNVIGYQTAGGTNGTNTNTYNHMHILRHLLTGQWGDAVTTTTQGTLIQRTYTYTVPASYISIPCVISNCDITVFVTESHQEIITGVEDVAVNGSHDGSTSLYTADLLSPSVDFVEGTQSVNQAFPFTFTSTLAGTEDFTFTISSDAPVDWTSTLNINSTPYSNPATVSLDNATDYIVSIDVVPGSTAALATYTLTVTSVNNPLAQPKTAEIYVISGITDLIVKGSGSWGDGNSYNFDQEYIDALTGTGNTSFAGTSAPIMVKGFNANALNGVNNLFMNIAWTFPSFTDEDATALINFMNNGGNVFVAGQDIGWDIMSGSGYGTTITSNLFTNYLHVGYSADGGTTNNLLTATTDYIFKTTPNSSVVDVYAGNMYPDQLTATGGSIPIFYYNNLTTKIAGLRFVNSTYKVVYLGAGLEMISNVAVRNQIIKTSHDWFYGLLTDAEMVFTNDNLNVYPNPSTDVIFIESPSKQQSVELVDITGKTILSSVSEGSLMKLDVAKVASGIYTVKVINEAGTSYRRIEIIK